MCAEKLENIPKLFVVKSSFVLECEPSEKNYMFGSCYQDINGEHIRIQKVAVRKYLLEAKEECERDLEVLRKPEQLHENFIRFIHIFEDQFQIYIALEHCKCSVVDFYDEEKSVNLLLTRRKLGAKQILRESAEGLAFLHGLGFLHRNIKPSNFLIASYSNDTVFKVKITDFRRRKDYFIESSKNSLTDWPPEWTPPEIFVQGTSLRQSVDVFPFGLYFYYVLFNGRHPFGDNYLFHSKRIKQKDDEVYMQWNEKICQDLEDEYETCWSEGEKFHKKPCKEEIRNAIRLIQRMLKFIPEKRIDLKQVLEDSYFQADDVYQIYDTVNKPGLVLLFNQEIFLDQALDIPFQEEKKKRLCRTFTSLGFDVEVYSNLFAKDIERTILQKSNEEGEGGMLKNYNCLIVCMLSHGNSGVVYGSDLEQVSIHKVQYAFNSKCCPSLHSKPKIFIIEACRNPERKDFFDRTLSGVKQIFISSGNKAVQEHIDVLQQPILSRENTSNLSPINDFFCAMSSLDGFESYTDKDSGFINTFCFVLEKDFEKRDLEDVFRKVQAEMSGKLFPDKTISKAKITKVQTPERISSLRKNVVFRKQDTRNTGHILLEEDFSIDEHFFKKRDGWNKWRSLIGERK